MADILIVYTRAPWQAWRPTYSSHLKSFERHSGHNCFYLNTFRPVVPAHLTSIRPDLVVFHYTFLAWRQNPEEFARHVDRISFIRDLECPKAIIPHDEQTQAQELCDLIRSFDVSHVFTPASSQAWKSIYAGIDPERVSFKRVLTGYIDEGIVRETAARARRSAPRTVDVGYRAWDVFPYWGRHGLLKGEIGRAFRESAPAYDLVTDISNNPADALLGDDWFDFLLSCKYTIGVEGGTSIIDRDGSIAKRTDEYTAAHPDAPFEEVEAACFPGLDGGFDYRLIGPRHLEAAVTKTAQVLVEGDYQGVLRAGDHYIELKRDFSNLDDVLARIKRDDLRAGMVERAYRDVVLSGAYSYRAFADLVFRETLGDERGHNSLASSFWVRWNHVEDAFNIWDTARRANSKPPSGVRRLFDRVIGQLRPKRLRTLVRRIRKRLRRT